MNLEHATISSLKMSTSLTLREISKKMIDLDNLGQKIIQSEIAYCSDLGYFVVTLKEASGLKQTFSIKTVNHPSFENSPNNPFVGSDSLGVEETVKILLDRNLQKAFKCCDLIDKILNGESRSSKPNNKMMLGLKQAMIDLSESDQLSTL